MAREELNTRILARLVELERNQAWLARKVDRDLSTVYRWLHGGVQPVPPRLLPRIAKVLDLDLAELQALEQAAEPEGAAA